jgi:hypothetical protein
VHRASLSSFMLSFKAPRAGEAAELRTMIMSAMWPSLSRLRGRVPSESEAGGGSLRECQCRESPHPDPPAPARERERTVGGLLRKRERRRVQYAATKRGRIIDPAFFRDGSARKLRPPSSGLPWSASRRVLPLSRLRGRVPSESEAGGGSLRECQCRESPHRPSPASAGEGVHRASVSSFMLSFKAPRAGEGMAGARCAAKDENAGSIFAQARRRSGRLFMGAVPVNARGGRRFHRT